MEQKPMEPSVYDFRRYDGVWRRVEPTIEPYPQQTGGTGTMQKSLTQPSLTPRTEDTPTSEENPCCMGSAAAEYMEVLAGYISEELADRAQYLEMARAAPQWAQRTLRDLAADEEGHARTLIAAQYLISGQFPRAGVVQGHAVAQSWLTALRASYHDEVCTAMNYARSAQETTDPCLARMLEKFSADEYRHAETVRQLLERSIKK